MKKNIFFAENLAQILKENSLPKYREMQIKHWLYAKKTLSFSQMLNLPKKLIDFLSQNYYICSSLIYQRFKNTNDQTEKIIVKFQDNFCVENAIIFAPKRITFCLSSQIGCPIGCIFCASGSAGFIRNLSAEEILDEFLLCCNEISSSPSNIVIMGVGEPLLNYENLMGALEKICSKDAFSISPRRITISTSGYIPGILRLAKENRPWNLALSLHATTDQLRKKMVPNINYPITDILSACHEYQKTTGRIVTIEYVLIDKLNSSEKDAENLAKIAKKYFMKINLIPFNQHPHSSLRRPADKNIVKFENILRKYNVPFTKRVEKGAEISAACGQLLIQKLTQNNGVK